MLACVAVGIAEWDVGYSLLTATRNLLILNTTRHPSELDAQLVEGFIVTIMYMKMVIGNRSLGKRPPCNQYHRRRKVKGYLPDDLVLTSAWLICRHSL